MEYPDAVASAANNTPRLSWTVFLTIAGFSALAVYCTFVSIHTTDAATGSVAAIESLKLYRQALAGVREFPYQWRLLGIYLVHAGEVLTGLDPHVVDVVLKAALLCLSSAILFLFSRFYTTESGALCAVALYLLATVAGFTEPYAIYFTNDYAMIACWFGAVYLVRTERYAAAVALTFVGAWAKETLLLVPLLMGFRWIRTRGGLLGAVLAGIAFLVPTVVLREIYRTPIAKWAWWDMAFTNVPFLQTSFYAFGMTLKNNLKVALFFNVLWILAARRVIRTSEPFLKDLSLTGIVYLVLAYPVIYIRELRHFLPLAILVLPVAIAELERHAERPRSASARVSGSTPTSR
jgi:hypothetical protein